VIEADQEAALESAADVAPEAAPGAAPEVAPEAVPEAVGAPRQHEPYATPPHESYAHPPHPPHPSYPPYPTYPTQRPHDLGGRGTYASKVRTAHRHGRQDGSVEPVEVQVAEVGPGPLGADVAPAPGEDHATWLRRVGAL
jgi:hypothetical protein